MVYNVSLYVIEVIYKTGAHITNDLSVANGGHYNALATPRANRSFSFRILSLALTLSVRPIGEGLLRQV